MTYTIQESEYDQFLAHYGTPRKSGRYPWGSGEQPQQHGHKEFLDYVQDLKDQGLSDKEVWTALGINSTQYRDYKTIAKNRLKQDRIHQINKLSEKGVSNVEIGKALGIGESQVRALRQPLIQDKAKILQASADQLRKEVDAKGAIDVGAGVEHHVMGLTRNKLDTAVALLKGEGYEVHYVPVTQVGTGKQTKHKVLLDPKSGITWRDMVVDPTKIQTVASFTEDHGRTWNELQPPKNFSSKRLAIKYAEDGGSKADGVLYVRPGVKDVELGGKSYAQVRVSVDGTHYIKGMAMYKSDLPPGVDIEFHTNKSKFDPKVLAEGKHGVLKPLGEDPNNPFGASLKRQIFETDAKGIAIRDKLGNPKVKSVMNLVNEEGSWDKWSRSLASQTLSKQSPLLAKQQLGLTATKKRKDLDEIKALTNPAVRKKLLETYAESVDASAVNLKAHRLPRSSWHAILPFNSLKENEIYAPNFKDGERVALIRFPHGGTFEIPELTVNNRHRAAKSVIGLAEDAVGINHKVAARLSGADFDGDAVLVIPNDHGHIKTTAPLEKLKGFDPQRMYKLPEGQKFSGNKQHLMGDVSNLITDMTIRGANNDEIARAVKHSMVVIDAEKHNLDVKRSANDNGISALKKRYQGTANKRQRGASTLISRAGAKMDVGERKPRSSKDGGPIDSLTGEKRWHYTGETYVNKKGQTVRKTFKAKKLAETNDARTLVSDANTYIERVYADHSNRLKSYANEARLSASKTPPIKYDSKANKVYAKEVESLNAKLHLAQQNAPLERHAQVIANGGINARKAANPNMDNDQLKKVRYQELEKARNRIGAKKNQIDIEDREWEAIQAGAITNHKLNNILNNADLERVKKLARPRINTVMTPAKMARAQQMLNSGFTQAEVAAQLGVNLSTLKSNIYGEEE